MTAEITKTERNVRSVFAFLPLNVLKTAQSTVIEQNNSVNCDQQRAQN